MRRLRDPLGDLGLEPVEWLVVQWVIDDRGVDDPVLAPGHLQDEHVVNVMVGREALALRGGDVGVDLRWVAELVGHPRPELHERGPGAVQALQDQRRAVGDAGQHLVVGGLVSDTGSGPAAAGVRRRRQDGAVLGHAQKRCSQPTLGDQLVHRGGGEQVREIRSQLGGAG
jgi:hypothetical protein